MERPDGQSVIKFSSRPVVGNWSTLFNLENDPKLLAADGGSYTQFTIVFLFIFFIVYITWIAKFLNKLMCKTDVCF